MDRREWLKAAGVLALGAGCRSAGPGLAPVNVSSERVIRTTVGLRPFRPSGFRVEAETFDDKTVVHNYGHGGGGMSLSWGSSHLAVEHAAATGADRVAIVGCGVMGLSTGRLLQKLGKTSPSIRKISRRIRRRTCRPRGGARDRRSTRASAPTPTTSSS